MEFVALEQGLRILIRLGTGAIVVEGDSLLDINAARKLQKGSKLGKVTKHWRMAKVTELIVEHLSSLDRIILQVVRRMENTMADCLANYGIDHNICHLDTYWHDVTCT